MCLTSPHRALHADYMLVNLGVVKSQFNQLKKKKKKKNVYRDREGGKKLKRLKVNKQIHTDLGPRAPVFSPKKPNTIRNKHKTEIKRLNMQSN